MPFESRRESNGTDLTLEGRLSVRDAAELWAHVAPVLEDGLPLRVHTRELEAADASILQILCCATRSGAAVTFPELGAGLRTSVEACGLRRELGAFLRDSAAGEEYV